MSLANIVTVGLLVDLVEFLASIFIIDLTSVDFLMNLAITNVATIDQDIVSFKYAYAGLA